MPAYSVSVVMPCYGAAGYIAESLDSVFAQTFRDFEVIVVNDGSPDTEAFERALEPYRSRVVYLHKQNGGASSARNAGIHAAQGEFVALLDPDDVWQPEYLETLVRMLRADTSAEVAYANAMLFGAGTMAGRAVMDVNATRPDITFEHLVTQAAIVPCASVCRREALLRAGLFDEGLRSAEDFELWLRIVRQGGRIIYTRDVLARYRLRPDSLTADPLSCCIEYEKALAKTTAASLTGAERTVVEKQLAFVRAQIELFRGKKQLFAGNNAAAITHLEQANAYFQSVKLTGVILALRFAPRMVGWVYDARDRVVLGRSTRL